MGTPAFRYSGDTNPLIVFKGRQPALADLPARKTHDHVILEPVKDKPKQKEYPLSYYKEAFQGITEDALIFCETFAERDDLHHKIDKACSLIHADTPEEANAAFFQHFFPISIAFEGTEEQGTIHDITTKLKKLVNTSPAVQTLYEENVWFTLPKQEKAHDLVLKMPLSWGKPFRRVL